MNKKHSMIIAIITLSGFMVSLWAADIKNTTEPKIVENSDAICTYDTCTSEHFKTKPSKHLHDGESVIKTVEVNDPVKDNCSHWYSWFPGHRKGCSWNHDREEARSRCKGNSCC